MNESLIIFYFYKKVRVLFCFYVTLFSSFYILGITPVSNRLVADKINSDLKNFSSNESAFWEKTYSTTCTKTSICSLNHNNFPNTYRDISNTLSPQADIYSYRLPSPTTVNTTTFSATCLCDGAVTLSLTAGCMLPPFSYSLSNGMQVSNTTSLAANFSSLCASSYNYTITTACDTIKSFITIGGPAASPSANIITNDASCTSPTGSVTITSVTNGVPNYTLAEGTTTLASNVNTPYTLTGVAVGSHTYVLTETSGCSTTFTANILNSANVPTVSVVSPVTLNCTNTTVTLNAISASTGSPTYSWAGPGILSGINSSNPTANQTGNYTVTISQGICSNSAIVTVNSNTILPNINIVNTGTLTCAVSSLQVIGSSTTTGVSYSWSPQNATTSITTINAPGNYTLEVTDAGNGCKSMSVVTISQNTLVPDINVIQPATLTCINTSITLAGTSTTSPVAFSWAPQNVITATAIASAQGSYTLTVTNSNNGCTSTSIIAIAQNTINPNLSINPVTTLNCTSLTATLSANSTSNVVLWNGPSLTSATNPATINLPGTYTVTSTNPINGCSKSQTLVVNQNTLTPTFVASVSDSLDCFNTYVNLTANSNVPNANYFWLPGNVGVASFTTSIPGIYTVTTTNPINGCKSHSVIPVYSSPTFTSNMYVLSQINCFADSNGVLQVNASSNMGPYSVHNLNTGFGAYTVTTFPYNLNGLTAGNYSVQITDLTSGCVQTLYGTINQPTVLKTAIVGNTVLCAGENTTLSPSASGGTSPYYYQWLPSGNITPNLIVASSSSINATAVNNITLSVSDNNGCINLVPLKITVHPMPNAKFVANDIKGCVPVCAAFSLLTPQNTGYTYEWQFYNTQSVTIQSSNLYNPNMCFNNIGVYSAGITITSDHGCKSKLTYNNFIHVGPKPKADFDLSPNPTTLVDPLVHFNNSSTGGAHFFWDFGDSKSNSTSEENNPTHTYTHIGNYLIMLIASNNEGCADTTYRKLLIEDDFAVYIPNTFTPNTDNLNDAWGPEGVGISDNDYELLIFDRWGQKIFNSTTLKDKWDGAYKGEPVKNDIYTYKVQCKAIGNTKPIILTGHVVVER